MIIGMIFNGSSKKRKKKLFLNIPYMNGKDQKYWQYSKKDSKIGIE